MPTFWTREDTIDDDESYITALYSRLIDRHQQVMTVTTLGILNTVRIMSSTGDPDYPLDGVCYNALSFYK